jgi:NADH:ubiquinone oxidoreductase subunit B-like Fe-S oxidoreductase
VIAVGACAISSGPYATHSEVGNGVEGTLPIDLYIPECPPHPLAILDDLLRLVGARGRARRTDRRRGARRSPRGTRASRVRIVALSQTFSRYLAAMPLHG